jgi:Zn-dependent peptidase ImmA (M78 family)/transcriptional regulator with XRE-family HTH domain
MFNPSRMSIARKRRRFTAKVLAERVGVSPVTITRLETGKNKPEAETVDAIARALKFPKEFFFGDEPDLLHQEAASFRSMTAMTAKERDASLSSGSLAFMVSDWVSERFHLPELDLPNLGCETDPSGTARSLRQHWGLGEQPISNMMKLLESKGVVIFSLTENSKNVDAFSCWRNDTPYIFLNTIKSAEHSRFDAAHELGHLVLHKHGGPHQGKEAEREANAFASSLLMPSADVLARIPHVSSIQKIIEAKKRWRVSAFALTHRLHRLQILSDWQYRTLCIQLTKRGYRTNELNGISREKSVVWDRILKELWKEGITKRHIAQKLHIPTAELESLIDGVLGAPEQVDLATGGVEPNPKLRLL